MEHRQRHDPSKDFVGFLVGDVHYAVAIARVREIANPLDVVPMPHAPLSVVGVADFRGDVVPVVDLRLRFGLEPVPATRKTKWIVVEVAADEPPAAKRLVALIVDSVTEVFGTSGAGLRPAPSLGGGEDQRGIEGVTTHEGGLVFVLQIGALHELTEPLVAAGRIAAHVGVLPTRAGT